MLENQEEGEVIKNWFYLPPEMRILIVDKLSPKDRFNFERCSKLCEQEAKKSKNYYYALKIVASERNVLIIALNDVYAENDRRHLGKSWEFEDSGEGTKWLIHKGNQGFEFWREKVDSWVDINLLAALYFEKFLQNHQNKIKSLAIFGNSFMNILHDYDFGIKSLKSLQNLELDAGVEVLHYSEKLRQPLNTLEFLGETAYPETVKEIQQVKYKVFAPSIEVDYNNMKLMMAHSVDISIGRLTERDILNFIQSWQNAIIKNKVSQYTWWIKQSTFDVNLLFILLGAGENSNFTLEIRHAKEAGKIAKLEFDMNLRFTVPDDL